MLRTPLSQNQIAGQEAERGGGVAGRKATAGPAVGPADEPVRDVCRGAAEFGERPRATGQAGELQQRNEESASDRGQTQVTRSWRVRPRANGRGFQIPTTSTSAIAQASQRAPECNTADTNHWSRRGKPPASAKRRKSADRSREDPTRSAAPGWRRGSGGRGCHWESGATAAGAGSAAPTGAVASFIRGPGWLDQRSGLAFQQECRRHGRFLIASQRIVTRLPPAMFRRRPVRPQLSNPPTLPAPNSWSVPEV